MEEIKINIDEIIKNGGCTLNCNALDIKSKSGYMVSLNNFEYKTLSKEDAYNKIMEYLELIKSKKNMYVGTWIDNDIIYIDISILIIDKVEALEFGYRNKQLAIYDLENNDSIYLSNYKIETVYTLYELIKNDNGIVTDIKIIRQNKKLYKIKEFFRNTRQTYNYIYSSIDGIVDKVVKYDYIIIKDYFITE